MGIPATLSQVPAVTPYIQYVATNGQTVFPYPFPITQDSDLIVVVNGVTLSTDQGYTLSGQGNPLGGNLTFTLGQTAGAIVTLFRDVTIERITQIAQNSGFSSTAFNAEFNNIYLLLQQLAESLSFCLQIPNTNNPAPVTSLLPGSYANTQLTFDAYGNPQPGILAATAVTAAIIGNLLAPRTSAEIAASVTPTFTYYPPGDLRRYGATLNSNVTTAFQAAVAQAQEAGGAPVYIPGALGTGCTVTAGVTISTPITVYGDGPYQSILTATGDFTVFTLTDDTTPGCVFRDFQLVGIGNQTAVITGYIVGTALTVSSVVSGAVATGQTIRGIGNTNGSTSGTTAFGLKVNSGSGTAWVVSSSGNVYSSGSPGKFYLGPASPGIVLTSSAYNQFHRMKISGFGYGVELQTGGNASFLNSFYNCQIISNSMANLYLQSQSHQTTLSGCTIGGGNVGWGAYVTDSSGFTLYGGDCEGTAQVAIELDNVASTGNGAHFISGVDFEGNLDVGGNIRIGNTAVVYGVTVLGCTFSSGGAGDNYAINPVTCTGLSVISCNGATGYGTEQINTAGTLSNLTLLGNRNMTTAGAASGANLVTYQGGVLVASGTAGIGYQAGGDGVGGAVTQTTNRTTAVTLNKLTGAITLFAANGSATAATFNVNNTTVAATDTVIVNYQGSTGTNTYVAFAVPFANGFQVVFYTTGGTASDSPVFNFTVIKGAAS